MAEVAIIIPTYNEAENVEPLVSCIENVFAGTDWEVLFVDDDSPDGTFQRVKQIGETNARVRGILRIGRRDLSSACVEGMLASEAPFVAVMDADHQHDEKILPAMLELLRSGQADLVIGSRYAGGGSSKKGLNAVRSAGSKLATALSRVVTKQHLSDPVSGFFMMRRTVIEEAAPLLYGKGYKILLDIIASYARPLRVVEVPYDMKPRHAGVSKLDTSVVLDFLLMLMTKRLKGLVPARFVLFIAVGLSGVAVHMGTLSLLYWLLHQQFAWSQALATLVAMTSNFFLNNLLTFGDHRLRGMKIVAGLFSFYLACGVGAIINVAIASFLFERDVNWALAGFLGAAVAAIWNFALSSHLTWRIPTSPK